MSLPPAVVRTAHASGLHSLVRSLDALHGEMLRSAADDAGQVRMSVLNLVAACTDRDEARYASELLTAIGARHPARAIVVQAHPEDGQVAIEADVSLHRASLRGHEIYTELMQLTVRGEAALHLASIVAPLLIPDIPTDLWVVGAPQLEQAFSDDVVALIDRIILDSGAYADPPQTLQLLASELRRHDRALVIGDFAWERSRAWRQMIAQAFGSEDANRRLRAIRSVIVESSGDHSPAQALLLAGWLASRLGWDSPRDILTLRAAGDNAAATLRRVHLDIGESTEHDTVTVALSGPTLTALSRVDGMEVSRVVAHEQPDVLTLMSRLLDEARTYTLYAAAVTAAAALL